MDILNDDHLTGDPAHNHCPASSKIESNSTTNHAQPFFGPARVELDSTTDPFAPVKNNLIIRLPMCAEFPATGLGTLQVAVDGAPAKTLPYGTSNGVVTIKVRLPDGEDVAPPRCIVLSWTTTSGSVKELTLHVQK